MKVGTQELTLGDHGVRGSGINGLLSLLDASLGRQLETHIRPSPDTLHNLCLCLGGPRSAGADVKTAQSKDSVMGEVQGARGRAGERYQGHALGVRWGSVPVSQLISTCQQLDQHL